jgi:AraC-like DNA-binding protein
VTPLTAQTPAPYREADVQAPPDADARYSVAASAVLGLLAYAARRRIPVGGVLATAGLDAASLAGPEARITQGESKRVWALVADASGDADFGLHFAEHLDVGAFGVVGHLATRCATFGEGLERVVAYSRLLHDAGRIETEREGPNVAVFPGCRGLPLAHPRHIAEFSAASVVVLGRAVTGEHLVPVSVRFRHPAPPRASEHLRVFGVAPSFDEPETAVVFEGRVLALPVRDPEPGVLAYLDAYARDVLAKLPASDDLTTQVERVVATAMSTGLPDVEQVASRLGMTSRTLQRRLADEETTYQAIVDGVRRSYAERYLADDRLALGEVAFLVGFSDPSNFHRAFRRWTGMTPAAYRAARGGR